MTTLWLCRTNEVNTPRASLTPCYYVHSDYAVAEALSSAQSWGVDVEVSQCTGIGLASVKQKSLRRFPLRNRNAISRRSNAVDMGKYARSTLSAS